MNDGGMIPITIERILQALRAFALITNNTNNRSARFGGLGVSKKKKKKKKRKKEKIKRVGVLDGLLAHLREQFVVHHWEGSHLLDQIVDNAQHQCVSELVSVFNVIVQN